MPRMKKAFLVYVFKRKLFPNNVQNKVHLGDFHRARVRGTVSTESGSESE